MEANGYTHLRPIIIVIVINIAMSMVWCYHHGTTIAIEFTRCVILLETTLNGCYSSTYSSTTHDYWTAGQRIDPSRASPFIWRVTSTNTCSETVSTMTYTNWLPGEPNYLNSQESCMDLWSGGSYGWNDRVCSDERCSVCEIDI